MTDSQISVPATPYAKFAEALALLAGEAPLGYQGQEGPASIATARMLCDVARYFDYKVTPVPVIVVVANGIAWDALQAGKQLDEVEGAAALNSLGTAHVVVVVGDAFLVDPCLCHLAQPKKGLPLPVSAVVALPGPFDVRQTATFTAVGGTTVQYQRLPYNGFKESPSWKESADTRRRAGAAIRAIRL